MVLYIRRNYRNWSAMRGYVSRVASTCIIAVSLSRYRPREIVMKTQLREKERYWSTVVTGRRENHYCDQ